MEAFFGSQEVLFSLGNDWIDAQFHFINNSNDNSKFSTDNFFCIKPLLHFISGEKESLILDIFLKGFF